MKRTIPQIIMLNHAAWREFKNAKIRADAKARQERGEDGDPFVPEYGCKLSEIKENPELFQSYMTDWRFCQ
jgi:hypothetical protein